ncbi:MAG TPA: hypothetical protein QGH10_10990 [Armatimonadota bacterium]|nr:hypothetical protein [Armatimonadota bacterium]
MGGSFGLYIADEFADPTGGLIAFLGPTPRVQHRLLDALPQLALQDEHLLPRGQDLTITVTT